MSGFRFPQLKLWNSICSAKLRNCPKQLDGTATIKLFCLHLFPNVTKFDFFEWMQNSAAAADDTVVWQGRKARIFGWVVLQT